METLSLSLSISISLSRRAEKKNDRPPSFFPLFCIFLELATICEPYRRKNTYHYQIRFRVGTEGFYREAIVLAFLFLFRRATTTLKRERERERKSPGVRMFKTFLVDRGHDRVSRKRRRRGRWKSERRSIALETLSRRKGRGSR